MNVFTITGHLAQDPELRYTPNQKPVTHLRVAVNSGRKNPDTNEEYPADFFSFEAWAGAENHAKYLQRGQFVEIVGRLRSDQWETDDGKRSRVVLVAERVQYGYKPNGTKTDTPETDTAEGAAEEPPAPQYDYDEEPF